MIIKFVRQRDLRRTAGSISSLCQARKLFFTPRRRLIQHATVLLGSLSVLFISMSLGSRVLDLFIAQSWLTAGSVLYWLGLSLIGAMIAIMITVLFLCVYIVWPHSWAVRNGLLPVCKRCAYCLDHSLESVIRCPECGTMNDTSKWVDSKLWTGEVEERR